jgi:hypothetical protein
MHKYLIDALVDARDFIDRTLKHGTLDTDSRVDLTEALKRVEAALVKPKDLKFAEALKRVEAAVAKLKEVK